MYLDWKSLPLLGRQIFAIFKKICVKRGSVKIAFLLADVVGINNFMPKSRLKLVEVECVFHICSSQRRK